MERLRLGLGLMFVFGAACFGVGCGGDDETLTAAQSEPGNGAAYLIVIQDFRFIPDNLEVPAGAMVTVRNLDEVFHSVTSQEKDEAYLPGAASGIAFDTGPFARGERTFTLPEGVLSGTEIPYYCGIHFGRMRNAARITIR